MLVPIKNAKALAAAIIRLLQNPDEQQRMGARGRERAGKEFNQEIIIQQTLDVYREIFIAEQCVAIHLRAARLRRDKEVAGKR